MEGAHARAEGATLIPARATMGADSGHGSRSPPCRCQPSAASRTSHWLAGRLPRRGPSGVGQTVCRMGFAELYVVREEWVRYELGEIAHIDSELADEMKVRTQVRTTGEQEEWTTDRLFSVSAAATSRRSHCLV